MNQKQLQYFVTVYQTKNIQTAADRLFVSRQGVSKVIRQRCHSNGLCNDSSASCQTAAGRI